MIFQEKACL